MPERKRICKPIELFVNSKPMCLFRGSFLLVKKNNDPNEYISFKLVIPHDLEKDFNLLLGTQCKIVEKEWGIKWDATLEEKEVGVTDSGFMTRKYVFKRVLQ